MSKPEQKLNVSDISFDDMIGDGLTPSDPKEDSDKNIDNLEDDPEEDEDENPDLPDDNDSDDEPKQKYKSVSDDDGEEGDFDDEDGEESTGSVADTIAKALGYELDTEYADTEEGLIEFTKDIAQNIAEEQLQELFQQFPLVQKHLDFVMAGGDPEKFFDAHNPTLDYNKIEIESTDTRMQKEVVAEFFKSKGHDEEFIKEMLEEFEDSGKLFDKAQHAKKQLGAIQERERGQMIQQQREQQQLEAQRQQEFWEDVAGRIDEGNEFAGIRIPDREKAKFFDYISAPANKNGQTKRDMDYAQSNIDVKLALDYLMYKGLKLEDIINTKAKTVSAKGLRDRIQGHQERVKNMGKVEKGGNKKFDPDNLDIKRLFE